MIPDLLRAAWGYRGFIYGSVQREFQSRYRNSLLGALWNIINPLAMIIVYTVIFSQLMHARLPGVENNLAYGIYLCSGLLTWGFFQEMIARGQGVFLDNSGMLKKLSFPRIALPIISVLSSLMNFLIIFSLFIGFLIITGNYPNITIVAVVPLLLLQILFAMSLGIILGVLNVFFRDIGQFMGVVLQFWFWFTPIIYPLNIAPKQAQEWIALNPMTPVAQAYQGIFVYGKWPDWSSLWPTFAIALILFIVALRLFRKRSGEIVDEL